MGKSDLRTISTLNFKVSTIHLSCNMNDVTSITLGDNEIFAVHKGFFTTISTDSWLCKTIPTTTSFYSIAYSPFDGNVYATSKTKNAIYCISPTTGTINLYSGSPDENMEIDGTINTASYNQTLGILLAKNSNDLYPYY
eukprot:TRINITY_DN2811_c0_g4_i1.p1 TRINITY_DN2811_c0_g4~~TRINITY_DN2811_c0_g4_i1.p1  ORF type:complete len:139 (-),score=25.35 TRINITY_DN2811_c0_g4_i1:514-930(-)